MHTINSILLASMLVTDDPNADAWDAVAWAREAQAMARDLEIPYAVTDVHGRAIVDALPTIDDTCDDCPITLRTGASLASVGVL